MEYRLVYNRTIFKEVIEINKVEYGIKLQNTFKNIKLKFYWHHTKYIGDNNIKRLINLQET